MTMKELVTKNRSYRRFEQSRMIDLDTLRELVDLARLSASGMNKQPLRYILSNTEFMNAEIFGTLAWAGYYRDWPGPIEGERPSAYIVMLKDMSNGTSSPQDQGIAAQSILLGAVEKGLGGCMIGNINKKELAKDLKLEENYEISLVIALGYPKEEVVIEEMEPMGDIKYWRDEQEVHHVPKRALKDIIL